MPGACRQPVLCQAARPPRVGGQPVRPSPEPPGVIELNNWLTSCRAAPPILDFVVRWGHAFDEVNAATALHRVAKCRPRDMRPVLAHPGWDMLLQAVHGQVSNFADKHLANTAWALALLQQAPQQLLADVLRAVGVRLQAILPRPLSNIVWSLAELKDNCPSFDPASVMPQGFLQDIEQQLPRLLPSANSQDISNFMVAFSTLGHTPSRETVESAARRFVYIRQAANTQDNSNMVLAFARFWHQSPGTFGAPHSMPYLTAAQCCSQPVSILLAASADHVLSGRHDASVQAVANTLWGLSEMGFVPCTADTERSLSFVEQRMPVRFDPNILCSCQQLVQCWCCAGVHTS